MRPVDCPGESRMRENLMSGLGRGSRKRGLRPRLLPTSLGVLNPTHGAVDGGLLDRR